MKRSKFILYALIFVLLLSLSPPVAATTVLGYCVAVDEWIPDPLTADTMPISINGQIYIPEGLITHARSNMGIAFARSDNNTLRLYRRSQILSFYLNEGTAVDQDGVSYEYRAVMRDGRAYFPMARICSFFNLNHNYYYTNYTDFPLIRITTANAVLSGDVFLYNAENSITDRRNAFLRSQGSATTSPPPDTTLPVVTTPTPTPSVAPENKWVHLSFTQIGANTADLLASLNGHQAKALFFFRPEDIAAHDDLVRQIIGQGHTIGIHLTAEYNQDPLASLAYANEHLEHVARSRSLIIRYDSVENVTAENVSFIQEAGYIFWRENVTVHSPSSNAAAFTNQLFSVMESRAGFLYLNLDGNQFTGATLSALLSRMGQSDAYRLRTPTITSLF